MKTLSKYSDLILAGTIIFILGLIIVPLPTFMLDLLIAISITISLLVLILSLYIQTPLDISIFPGLLLITTLFRLGLNISSTRLILLEGFAGHIIDSFGNYVIGGNYVVGVLVFIIIVVIQFIVIIKGSTRISEVAARFTLDAMPGKQMSIDADLSSGLITESEARTKRENISREAEFFGSMDGASKFVKGDAIAGLIIIGINIIAGFIIGVAQRGLTIQDALKTYTILTIGDGLVSQIPALLISTAAGFVVTKSGSGSSLDTQFKTQLISNPRVLAAVSGAAAIFSVIPGMPTLIFLMLSIGIGVKAYFGFKEQKKIQVPETSEETESETKEENVERYLQVDPIEIEIGYGLISLVDENQGGNLFQKIASTRKFIALEYGVLIPPVRVRDNLQLNPNEYIIKIKGNVVAGFEIYTDRYLAMNPGNIAEPLQGIPTKDPAFNLEAYWVNLPEKDRGELLGYTVVDSISVLSTHLQETLKSNFDKILSRQAVKNLLENLKKEYPAIVDDVNPELLSLGVIQKVLQNLLKELVPIKDLVLILEALIDYSKITKNIDVLTEYVRHSLGETIANIYRDPKGVIHVMGLEAGIEDFITRSLQNQKESAQTLGFTPQMLKEFNVSLTANVEKFRTLGYQPLIITSATIRPYIYRLIHSSFTDIAVISYTELPSDVELEFIAQVELEYAG